MSLLHVNCPGYDVYSLEEEGVLTKMKKMLMKGKKRSLVSAWHCSVALMMMMRWRRVLTKMQMGMIDEDGDEKP